jgi:mannosyltransferase
MDAAASGSAPLTQPEELSAHDGRSDVGVEGDVSDIAAPASPSLGGVAVVERPAPSTTVPPGDPPSSAPPEATTEDPEGPRFRPATHLILAIAVAVAIGAGLVLRFWTTSDLWLDEALTVNIARLPLHDLPSFLRRDGAPPLYYVLLHVWMGWFGQSDLAVRSLSGVIGVITLPLVWLAGRRLGGTTVAWAVLILVTTSPFAVRYDTETRMYSLVALLTVLGFLALDRALQRPRPGNLVAVAAVTGLLLYTHYWSIYLIGTVFLWLAFEAWRGRAPWRRGARAALVAVVVGCLTFLPWLPTFLFQSRHTGTPWATPANFAAMVSAIASFAGGTSNQGRALALLFFALAGLGLFGLAVDRRHVDLDLLTRPRGRPLAIAVTGTLAAAIIGGFVTKSAFDARYASVVFIPLLLLVALGIATFRDRRVRAGLVVAAGVLGLAGSLPNVTTNRTQAGQVAARVKASGKPGDVIAYCPDQLGPAVYRLLPTGRYQQITFPRESGPEFVNWVNYTKAVSAGSVLGFAARVEALADAGGTRHSIFMVWAPGYQSYGVKCEGIVDTLQSALTPQGTPAYRVTGSIAGNGATFYQPMWMVQLSPNTG